MNFKMSKNTKKATAVFKKSMAVLQTKNVLKTWQGFGCLLYSEASRTISPERFDNAASIGQYLARKTAEELDNFPKNEDWEKYFQDFYDACLLDKKDKHYYLQRTTLDEAVLIPEMYRTWDRSKKSHLV